MDGPWFLFLFVGLIATAFFAIFCAAVAQCCRKESKNTNTNLNQQNGKIKRRRMERGGIDSIHSMGSSMWESCQPGHEGIGYDGGPDADGCDSGGRDIEGGCDTTGGCDNKGGCDSNGGCDTSGGCDTGGGCDSGGGGVD